MTAPCHSLSEPARLLMAGVAAVRAQCPTDLPGPQALDEARLLFAELDTLRAVTLTRIGDIETRGLHALDAAPSVSSWVERQATGVSRDDVALARKLTRLAGVADAVARGTLPLAAAAAVGVALDKTRRHLDRGDGQIGGRDGETVLANVIVEGVLAQVAEARGGFDDDDPALQQLIDELLEIWQRPAGQAARLEAAFVLCAQRLERQLLAQALDRLVDAVLPDLHADAVERSHLRRGLTLALKADGSGYTITRGDLDLECGAYLLAVIAAQRATDPRNPTDTAGWAAQRHDEQDVASSHTAAPGAPPSPLPVPSPLGPLLTGPEPNVNGSATTGSTRTQPDLTGPDPTRPDLPEPDLTGLVAGEYSAPAPRSRAQQNHDALSLGLRALLDSGTLGVRGKTAPHVLVTVSHDAMHDVPGALPATTADGARFPIALVRRLLCDSRLTRVVLSLGRRVVDVSHTERTLKAHERTALHVRWGGRCAGAGCTAPVGTPLVPHHATPWHLTGTTALDDTVPFCPVTHHDLHEGQQTIKLRDGRYLTPQGWLHHPDG